MDKSDTDFKLFVANPSYENLKGLVKKNTSQKFNDLVFDYLFTKKQKYNGDKNDFWDMLGLINDDVGVHQVEQERRDRFKIKFKEMFKQ